MQSLVNQTVSLNGRLDGIKSRRNNDDFEMRFAIGGHIVRVRFVQYLQVFQRRKRRFQIRANGRFRGTTALLLTG